METDKDYDYLLSLLAFFLPSVGRGVDPITRHLDTFSLGLCE